MDQFVKLLIAQKREDTHLYRLNEVLSNTRVWNYELPTLTVKGRFTKHQQWTSVKEFEEVFLEKFPIFKEVDMTNIAVLGGAIFDILHHREHSIHDIDLFLIGDFTEGSPNNLSEIEREKEIQKAILRRAEKFIDDIYSSLERTVERLNAEEEKNAAVFGRDRRSKSGSALNKVLLPEYISNFKATRNGAVLTLHPPTIDVPIQFVLAPNSSVASLLQCVDLDCTAIAYCNGELYFNSLSKFCYENGCVIMSDFRGETTHEARLQKYFSEKGMDVILPFLDVSKIPNKNLEFGVSEVIDLPYLAIVYDEINDNKIITNKIVPRVPINTDDKEGEGDVGPVVSLKKARISRTSTERASRTTSVAVRGSAYRAAYQSSVGINGVAQAKHSGIIIHENIVHLLHHLPQKFQFYGEGRFVKDILLPIPKLTQRMITNTFENICDRLCSNQIDGLFDVTLLEKYFVVKKPSEILEEILVEPLKEVQQAEEQEKQENISRKRLASLFDEQYEHQAKEYFQYLVKLQIQDTEQKLAQLQTDYQQFPEKFLFAGKVTLKNELFPREEWYGRYLLTENV